MSEIKFTTTEKLKFNTTIKMPVGAPVKDADGNVIGKVVEFAPCEAAGDYAVVAEITDPEAAADILDTMRSFSMGGTFKSVEPDSQ